MSEAVPLVYTSDAKSATPNLADNSNNYGTMRILKNSQIVSHSDNNWTLDFK